MFLVFTIKSSRSNFTWAPILILVSNILLQMSCVNVFAVGGAGESDRWEDISEKALSLDRDDFLTTGYKVSAKFKNVVRTPSSSRPTTRPTYQSPSTPAKNQRRAGVKDVVSLSEDDDEEDEPEEDLHDDDDVNETLEPVEPIASAPTRRQGGDVPVSSPSSMISPPDSHPRPSSSASRKGKRKERDSLVSVVESLAAIFKSSQQRHDEQLVEIQTRQDRDRVESMRLHEEVPEGARRVPEGARRDPESAR